MTNIREKLEQQIIAEVKPHGIGFSKLQLKSAADEMRVLDTIELNNPSKLVTGEIHVSFPNPKNKDEMISTVVTHEYRQQMNEVEANDHADKLALERAAEYLAAHPEEAAKFLKGAKPPKQSPKKRK